MKKGINIAVSIVLILISIGLFIGAYFGIQAFAGFISNIPDILSNTCEICLQAGENVYADSSGLISLGFNFKLLYILPAILLLIGIYFLIISLKQNA